MLKNVFKIIRQLYNQNIITYIFFSFAVISCLYTYWLFSDINSVGIKSRKVLSVLYVDLILILILISIAINKVMKFWNERHRKGSRLTIRLIKIFSGISIFPSILMCTFSSIFFHNGLESWFNSRNQTVLQDSLKVAESYFNEHKKEALSDCIAISRVIESNIENFNVDEEHLAYINKSINSSLDDLCNLKNIDSAILVNSGNIIAHSKYSVNLHFINITNQEFQNLKELVFKEKNGIILNIKNNNPNILTIATCFKASSPNLNDKFFYLIAEKKLDPQVLLKAQQARAAYTEYFDLLEKRNSLEISFIIMFFIVGILILILSIIAAIAFSWRIVHPVSNLIDVSEQIIDGNLSARAANIKSIGELKILSDTFNRMIEQVHQQQKSLKTINEKLDEKVKFISSVLSGVSSGIIGIDGEHIYIWNKRAEELLGKSINFGETIFNLFHEIKDFIYLSDKNNELIVKECKYRRDNEILLFSVKLMKIFSGEISRYVITFDDLTDTVIAQRKAAWSEVARRVAHEIKNPLTPIQLSAERIKRKYSSQIKEESDTFFKLIDIIVKQVGDIKRLIDEFNFFARLPDPKMRKMNLEEICSQAIFLMNNTVSDIDILFSKNEGVFEINGDERLIHQCIVNLIKNSINALSTVEKEDKKIWISLIFSKDNIKLNVEDNGPGLPKDKMESLATPYFSLLPKGTGLGLAIVKKIIQDHQGSISFGDSIHGGACVTLTFPVFME